MKTRNFEVLESTYEWNFSGLHCGKQHRITVVRNFKPTVSAVRELVKELFPEYSIDETYETLKEQISDGLEIGSFSVRLTGKDTDMFFSRSVCLQETFR